MDQLIQLLKATSAWLSRVWKGQAYLLLEQQLHFEREQRSKQLQHERESSIAHERQLLERIGLLEQRERDYQDRILMIKNVPPIQRREPQTPKRHMTGFEAATQEALNERLAFYTQQARMYQKQPTDSDSEPAVDEGDAN
ncbi:MAG: hypothetical protein AB1489_24585 [Acidobacteriota bacterium]